MSEDQIVLSNFDGSNEAQHSSEGEEFHLRYIEIDILIIEFVKIKS